MIRHTSSFFISLILHALIVALLFLAYKEYKAIVVEKNDEHMVCVQLSCMGQKGTPPPLKKQLEKIPPKKTQQKIKKIIVKKDKVIIEKKSVLAETISKPTPIPLLRTKEVKEEVSEKVVTPVPQKVSVQKSMKTSKTEQIKKETEKVKSPEKEYVEEHIAEIIALLQENLYYPRRARKRGVQGKVLIRFTLSKNAEVSEIEVLSSKSDILSRGAIKTIENIEYKLPKPKQRLTFNVPISYSLK